MADTDLIESFKIKLSEFLIEYEKIETEKELKEVFNEVCIMFIKEILKLYNKCLPTIENLNTPACAEKISNLNILLQSLETDKCILGYNCNDIIIRAYMNYFYKNYREDLMTWNIDNIKAIDENDIKNLVLESAKEEKLEDTISEYLNIIPEVVLIINKLRNKEIITLFYILNNMNIILDTYIVKKYIT